jgi:O-antigen/teichoic acid export membrane protein
MIQITGFSLDAGVAYYGAKKQINQSALAGFSFLWTAIATVIAALIFIPVYRISATVTEFSVLPVLAYVAGNLLISFGNAICFSGYRFVLPHVIAIIVNGVLSALLLSGYVTTITSFATLYFNAFLLQGLLLMICIAAGNGGRFLNFPSGDQIRLLFRYGSQAFLANILFFLLNRTDYLFVRHYCAPADLGNYIQVSKIAQLFFLLPSMIATVLFPVIAANNKNIEGRLILKLSAALGLAYTILLILLVATGRHVFPWIYGQSFQAMYIPFVLQCPGIIAMAMIYPHTAYNSGHDRIRINTIGTGIALAVLLAGDILFIPGYGIRAAATISSLGYCCYYAFLIFSWRTKTAGP